MALSERQVSEITDDAVNLRDALEQHGVDPITAGQWVAAAMDAIVINATDPPAPDEPVFYPGEMAVTLGGVRYPVQAEVELGDAKAGMAGVAREAPDAIEEHDQQNRANVRLGNITSLGGIDNDVIDQLAAGPDEGHEMRLVKVHAVPGELARTEAMAWVRENVPGAGKILSTTYAGTTPPGHPVYLVTFELPDTGGPRHVGGDTGERKS